MSVANYISVVNNFCVCLCGSVANYISVDYLGFYACSASTSHINMKASDSCKIQVLQERVFNKNAFDGLTVIQVFRKDLPGI